MVTTPGACDTARSSTASLRSIFGAGPCDGLRPVLEGSAGHADALSGLSRHRDASTPEHVVRHAVRRTADEPRPLSPVRLSEHSDWPWTVSRDLLRAEVSERARDHSAGDRK